MKKTGAIYLQRVRPYTFGKTCSPVSEITCPLLGLKPAGYKFNVYSGVLYKTLRSLPFGAFSLVFSIKIESSFDIPGYRLAALTTPY